MTGGRPGKGDRVLVVGLGHSCVTGADAGQGLERGFHDVGARVQVDRVGHLRALDRGVAVGVV